MKNKTALITGVSGQDGAYLAEYLLKKNYIVVGADRRSARSDMWRLIRLGIQNDIIQEDLELTEPHGISRLLKKYQLDEIYNLAAQSFVQSSFTNPIYTSEVTGIGVLRILEAIKEISPKTKFYQASSSEMFGKILEKKQNEVTPFYPRSPYAVSKVFGHYITKNYRESYNLFAVSGILFNHESPLRGEDFVTRKITLGLTKIMKNDLKFIELGNIYAERDWGYAKEYVEAMWKMLQQKKPEDFVISTGRAFSIKDFINEAVNYSGLKTKWVGSGLNEKLINTTNNQIIIKINPRFFRPAEVEVLTGKSLKAKKILNWYPKISFKKLVILVFLFTFCTHA